MATDYKALGKRISNARKQAGITQEALGEQLNMTRKHISVIESAIKRPSLDALVDIANALDVSTDDLLVDSLSTRLQPQIPKFTVCSWTAMKSNRKF